MQINMICNDLHRVDEATERARVKFGGRGQANSETGFFIGQGYCVIGRWRGQLPFRSLTLSNLICSRDPSALTKYGTDGVDGVSNEVKNEEWKMKNEEWIEMWFYHPSARV